MTCHQAANQSAFTVQNRNTEKKTLRFKTQPALGLGRVIILTLNADSLHVSIENAKKKYKNNIDIKLGDKNIIKTEFSKSLGR